MHFRSIPKLQWGTGIIITHVHFFMDSVVLPIRLVQPQEIFLQMFRDYVSFHVSYSKGRFLLPTGEFTIVSIIKDYLINLEETLYTSQR